MAAAGDDPRTTREEEASVTGPVDDAEGAGAASREAAESVKENPGLGGQPRPLVADEDAEDEGDRSG